VAIGHAIGEALLFDPLKASIVGREFLVELLEGVAEFGWDGLSAIHVKIGYALCSPCCQGIYYPNVGST